MKKNKSRSRVREERVDVVLINPAPSGKGLNEATIEPPVGLGYIAAMLEKEKFSCKIIDNNLLQFSQEKVLAMIPQKTLLIGFYLNSFTFNSVKELAELIRKKRKNTAIILGGPLASSAPKTVLEEIICDGLVRGEGEYATLQIIKNLKKNRFLFRGKISGATYLNKKEEMVSNPVSRITNLDEIPFPAYHLFPTFNRYKSRTRKSPFAPIVTSRGCPHACTFCSKDIFQRVVIFRSAKNVLKEIKYLAKYYNVRQIDILDDNFAQHKNRFEEILEGLAKIKPRLAINLQSGIRTELLNEENLLKMKKAGIFKLAFGIESADEKVLALHKKALNLKKVEESIALSKKMGFAVYGFFIIGLPGETERSFNKSLAFIKKTNLDIVNFSMAIPFVGTELYKMIEEKGRFLIDTTKNIDSGFYDGKVFFEYGNSKAKDVLRRYKKAYKKFYTFKKQIQIILGIRSFSEFLWLIRSTLSVASGVLKK